MSLGQYDPLKWPPDIKLAQMHYNCCKAGIDNPQGSLCPCCDRFQKLQNNKWAGRDIIKDFKNYGGGVPGYFYLLCYFIVVLLVLTLVKVIYHIVMVEKVCAYIDETYSQASNYNQIKCRSFLGLKMCETSLLYEQLKDNMNMERDAEVLQYLQLAAYLILVITTLGIKIFFQYINKDRISLDQKLFSRFSLIIKNVPLYYQLEDLKEQMRVIDPKIQFNQAFYLHKSCQFNISYKKLFNLYFQISLLEQNVTQDDRQKKIIELKKKYQEYLALYDQVEIHKENLNKNGKKILVVFNTIDQKESVHKALKISEFFKFLHYLGRILGINRSSIGYYSERLAQPQQICWNNIGQSSTHKQKVRLETTFIGVGFMVISFAIFYFPMYKIDQEKYDKPGLGSGLSVIISILIIVLSIIYRQIILSLTPKRRATSKLAESYFIVMTTVVFHFFFFLVTPATFYVVDQSVPKNMKLKFFFSNIFSFTIITLLIASLDLQYRFNKKKRQKLLSQVSQSNKYCQQRLHEQITPPSFPIQFKLMVVFNIWSFNSFYIFQIPSLIFLFMIILFCVYWIDKHNLYKHYKMQQYISIELLIKLQKTYIVIFLICVSIGYYFSVVDLWEKIVILVVFVVALAANFILNYNYKKQKDSILKHNTDLQSAIQKCRSSMSQNMHLNMLQNDIKRSFLISPQNMKFSQASLASAVISYGYLQTYNLFLSQFNNKELKQFMEAKYMSIKHSKTVLDGKKRKESQLARFFNQGNIEEKLIQQKSSQSFIQNSNQQYKPLPTNTTQDINSAQKQK